MNCRLAYVCADPGVPIFGQKGCSIHVQEILRAFLECGIGIELFCARLGGDPSPDLSAIAVHQLPSPTDTHLAGREQQGVAANEVLLSQLQRAGPFDAIYERYSLWSFAAMDYAKRHGVPSILEVNAPLVEEQVSHRGLVDRELADTIARRVFRSASMVSVVSDEVGRYVRAHAGLNDRVHTIPNGVNPLRFNSGQTSGWEWPDQPRPFTLGFVGTLKPWHGLETLILAFAQVQQQAPEARLLIVGDGPQRSACVQQLQALGLAKACHFTGAVPPESIAGWLGSMDVAIAPYPAIEKFYFSPLKVYEYMAAGTAVVASDIGQIASLIQHGVTGLLCKPGDAGALAREVLRLRGNAELRHAMGRAAREQILSRHTWKQVAEKVIRTAGLFTQTKTEALACHSIAVP